MAIQLPATCPVVPALGVGTDAVPGRSGVASRGCPAAAATRRAGAAAYGLEVTHNQIPFRLRELDSSVMRASLTAHGIGDVDRRHQVDDIAAGEAGEIALAVDDHAAATAQAPRPRGSRHGSDVYFAHLIGDRVIGSVVAIGTTFLRAQSSVSGTPQCSAGPLTGQGETEGCLPKKGES